MSWHEDSPYSHHTDVLGRVLLTQYERQEMRRQKRVELLAKVVVLGCAGLLALAVWG